MKIVQCLLLLTTFSSLLAGEPENDNTSDFKKSLEDFLHEDKLANELNAAKQMKLKQPIDDSDELLSLAKMWSQAQEAKKRLQAAVDSSPYEESTQPAQTKLVDVDTDHSCFDIRKDCAELKLLRNKNFCIEMSREMSVVCNKTCFCGRQEEKVTPTVAETNVCRNNLNDNECKILDETFHACSKRPEKMKLACSKYCGFCKITVESVETSCLSTQYGCCWDGKTASTGPKGAGCPACEDDSSVTYCQEFKSFCTSPSVKGTFMIKNCPKTCGACDGSLCRDASPESECMTSKQNGYCQTKADVMFTHCRKTCNLCIPPCKDHEHCKKLTQIFSCNNSKLSLELKHMCPVTCGMCRKAPVDNFLDALSSLK